MFRLFFVEFYSFLRHRGLLIALVLLIVLSFIGTSQTFTNTAGISEENLSQFNLAFGARAKTVEEFLQWYRTEHFRDFIFRKSFENNAFILHTCGLLLSLFFFALPDYKRESSAAMYAGVNRRNWFLSRLLWYLVLTLLAVNIPMLLLFIFRIPGWVGNLPDYALRDLLIWLLYQLAVAMNYCFVMVLTKNIFKNVGLGLLLAVFAFVAAGATWMIRSWDFGGVWYGLPLFLLCPSVFPMGGQVGTILLGADALSENVLLTVCTLGTSIPLHACAAYLLWRRRDLQ